jgi:uncharacterized protein YgiM (DUF1202 family)
MFRASHVAILALLLIGASTMACTNETGGPSGGKSGTVSSRKRDPNTASGEIEGAPETPSSAPSGNGTDNSDDGADGDDAQPAPSDPGTTPPPADPDPADPDPIPVGSFAVGTELVTTANLNIREGADTTFAIITTVPKGSSVFVESVSGASGWVNVSFQGNVGWSSKSYLTVP